MVMPPSATAPGLNRALRDYAAAHKVFVDTTRVRGAKDKVVENQVRRSGRSESVIHLAAGK